MKVNGTLMNYYFHCKRQCYLHGNRVNLEDNSENVRIGKAIHEEKAVGSSNSEIAIENIKLDKLTAEISDGNQEIGCRRRSRQVAALLLFVRFKDKRNRTEGQTAICRKE